MKVGMSRRTLKSTTIKKEYYKKKKFKDNKKKPKLSKCLQTNPWPHFSEDQPFPQMDNCSYYLAEFGDRAPQMIPYAVHIYSGKTISPNLHSPFKLISNQF